jgi:hypothetical protein
MVILTTNGLLTTAFSLQERRGSVQSREGRGMRRFTRLTNGFSKKLDNHAHMVALHFLYYNFARIHKTLRITPAMAAGLSGHVWSFEEIAALAN